MSNQDRRCPRCGLSKPATAEFFPRRGQQLRSVCRECRRAAQRSAYRANPAPQRERARAYHEQHREKRLAYLRTWLAENRNRQPEYRERWAALNPEKFIDQARRSTWSYAHKQRAMHYGVLYEAVDRRAVYEAAQGRCGICGEHVPYEVATYDHQTPLSRGGTHTADNLVPAHKPCNSSKRARMPEEVAALHQLAERLSNEEAISA